MELKLDDVPHDPSREVLQEYELMKMIAAGSVLAHPRVTPNTWEEFETFLYELLDSKVPIKN